MKIWQLRLGMWTLALMLAMLGVMFDKTSPEYKAAFARGVALGTTVQAPCESGR